MEAIIEISNLTKRFVNCEALRGVDMIIPKDRIVGLLGPNASGKTTLLKTMAGLLQPTAGSVRYYEDAEPGPDARQTISFCPDVLVFRRWMRVRDAFAFYEGVYSDYSQTRADEIMRILELQNIADTHIRNISRGMRERLALGLTFSRDTKLYLLDEPLDGIDPIGKMKVQDAILALQPEGASTIVSTHLVKDIERIFTDVYFLSKGKVIFSGACDVMREERGQTVEQTYLEVFINEGSV